MLASEWINAIKELEQEKKTTPKNYLFVNSVIWQCSFYVILTFVQSNEIE